MTKILATCVLLVGFLFTGCVSVEEQTAAAFYPLLDRLPEIVRAVEADHAGGDVVITIVVDVDVHKLF